MTKFQYLTKDEAIDMCHSQESFIIKRSIFSGCGRDVVLMNGKEASKESIEAVMDEIGSDFIVQEVITPHPVMASFNPSSVNTIRLYSLLPPGKTEHVILGAAVRFGGEGSYKDNASQGGGFCGISKDGVVSDKIFSYCNWNPGSLKELKGLEDVRIPSWDKVCGMVLNMHNRLPHLDMLGWDIAISDDGEPLLIELNVTPDLEILQLCHGPAFGEYLDDIMALVADSRVMNVDGFKREFPNAGEAKSYFFDLTRNSWL